MSELALTMTMAELQVVIVTMGSPQLRVWWDPDVKKWCAMFSVVKDGETLGVYGKGETLAAAVAHAAEIFMAARPS